MVQLTLDLEMSPPQDGGNAISAGFPDDDIRQLGDTIASLRQASLLRNYLESIGLTDVSL